MFHVAKLEAVQTGNVYSVDMLISVHIPLQRCYSIVAFALPRCGMHLAKLSVLLLLMGKQLACGHSSLPLICA